MFAVYLPIYICTTASFYLSLQQTTEGWRKQPGDKTVYYVSTPSSKSKQAGQKLEIVTDSLQNRNSLCIMSGIILVVYWKYTRSVMMHVFSRTVAAVDTKRGYVGMCNGRSAQHESGAASSNWLFRLFSRHISRTQSFQQNRHIHFHALVALKLLVYLISCPVARSPRIVVDKQTNRQTDMTNTQTKYCNPRCARVEG